MSLRFAIGRADGPQSCSWKLWTQGDEAYLLQRGVGAKHHKFSFHKSGNCRWALIRPGVSGAIRAMLEWERDPVPPRNSGQGCLLLSLAFPTNHLSFPQVSEQKGMRWIDAAPPGWAVMVEIMGTEEDETTIGKLLDTSGIRRIFYCKALRNGMHLCATVSSFDCGPVDLISPRPHAIGAMFGEVAFPDRDDRRTGRPIRMLLMPSSNLPPTVWELGGYQVQRDEEKFEPRP